MQLVAPQVLDSGGVGRAPEESGELTDHADITGLRVRCELAHAHVVDHVLAQRTDTLAGVGHGSAPVEERGGLPRTQHGNRAGFLSPATRAQPEPPTARAVSSNPINDVVRAAVISSIANVSPT